MKKLLGIVVLGLLWCNVSFSLTNYSKEEEQKYNEHLDNKCNNSRLVTIKSLLVSKYKVDLYGLPSGSYQSYSSENCKDRKIIIRKLSTNEVIHYEEFEQDIYYDVMKDFNRGTRADFFYEDYIWLEYCMGSSGCKPFGFYLGDEHAPSKIYINSGQSCLQNFGNFRNKIQCNELTKRKEFDGANCALALWTYDKFVYEFNYKKYTKALIKEDSIDPECRSK